MNLTVCLRGVANPLLTAERSGAIHSPCSDHKSRMSGTSNATAIHAAYTTVQGIYHASSTFKQQPDKQFIHFHCKNYHCACGKRPVTRAQCHGNSWLMILGLLCMFERHVEVEYEMQKWEGHRRARSA